MRMTIRRRLMVVVAIAAVACGLFIGSGELVALRVEGQMRTIYAKYLPMLELEPLLQDQLETLSRGFQDAVASRDLDSVAAASAGRARFLAYVDAAGTAIDAADAARLRAALDAYCTSASDISRRLITGETGEDLVDAVRSMQDERLRLSSLIAKTATFDQGQLAQAFASVTRAQRDATSYQAWIGVACVISVLVLSLGLSRGVLRTLEGLTLGFARFGEGDFSRPIVVEGRDELADVARHANQMAANLDELGRQRDRAEAALKLANRELEAFSYSVAHDLRAPLRGINGFSRALLEDFRGDLNDEAKEYLDRIAAGALRMGELIDALLDLSRVTRARLHRDSVDLTALANGVFKQLSASQPDRVVDFVASEGVGAYGDPLLLRALFDNLIGNAWKFTSRRSPARIEFGRRTEDGMAVYFVCDNGAGFDPASAGRLFSQFQRLHRSDEFPGTGIGLATVQRIVGRHGGRIWAEGEVDRGATFFFTLPDKSGDES